MKRGTAKILLIIGIILFIISLLYSFLPVIEQATNSYFKPSVSLLFAFLMSGTGLYYTVKPKISKKKLKRR